MLEVVATVADVEAPAFVLLVTTNSVSLTGQTIDRFADAFHLDATRLVWCTPATLSNTRRGLGMNGSTVIPSTADWRLQMIRAGLPGYMGRAGVIIAKKNKSDLRNAQTLMNDVNASRKSKGFAEITRLVIIDDEADQASLNGKASRQDDTSTAIYSMLRQMSGQWAGDVSYYQFTATPQANLSLSADSDMSPSSVYCLTPGTNYRSIGDFFGIAGECVKSGSLYEKRIGYPVPTDTKNAKNEWKLLLGDPWNDYAARVALSVLHGKGIPAYSTDFLFHPCQKKEMHYRGADVLRTLSLKLQSQLLASTVKSDISGINGFIKSCERIDLLMASDGSSTLALSVKENPAFRAQIANALENLQWVVFNSDERIESRERLPKKNGATSIVYIGGTGLGRGVSFPHVSVMVMWRWSDAAKMTQIDTALQAARFLGYRSDEKQKMFVLYIPEELKRTYANIAESDRVMREQLLEMHNETGGIHAGRIELLGAENLRPSATAKLDKEYDETSHSGHIVSFRNVPDTLVSKATRAQSDNAIHQELIQSAVWTLAYGEKHLKASMPGKAIAAALRRAFTRQYLTKDELVRANKALAQLEASETVPVYRFYAAKPNSSSTKGCREFTLKNSAVKNFKFHPPGEMSSDAILREDSLGGVGLSWFGVRHSSLSEGPYLGIQIAVPSTGYGEMTVYTRDHRSA